MMRTIVFASYKGGVGRTLAVANFAHFLAGLGQRVVATDLDLETPGLHYRLEPARRPSASASGALDLFESFADRRPLPLDDALVPVRSEVARGAGAISLIGAGAGTEGYWQRLASFPWRRLLAGGAPHEPARPHIDLRAGEALLSLQAELELSTSVDVWLVDAPSGLSELADLAATLLADDVVLTLANNRESLAGTAALITALASAPRLPRADGSARPLRVFPVLTRLPALADADERAIVGELEEQLRCTGEGPVHPITVLHECAELSARERVVLAQRQRGVASSGSCAHLVADYLRLFSRLVPAELFESDLREQTEGALRLAYEDPARAARALEDLATRLPHPITLRALLKYRRLSRTFSADTLFYVHELLAATGDPTEPLVADVVAACAPLVADVAAPDPAWCRVVEQVDGPLDGPRRALEPQREAAEPSEAAERRAAAGGAAKR